MGEWFEDWFASDLYLDVYKHRDEKDALKLLELISRNISLQKTDLILDAACGAGRYTNILAGQGYKVVGFDLSLPLLRTAKRNYLNLQKAHPFFRADIREVQLRQKFNLILNVFTSFGYFEADEENFAFVNNSIEFLRADGCFVFDYINKPYLERTLVPKSEKRINEYKIFESRKIENDRVVKNIKIEKGSDTHNFVESVKLYLPDEIIKKFSRAGYRIISKFGSYSGDEFNENNSERFIGIFQK